ncbi:YndM family protein [Fodinisporobacter ferrooxydans]|uniref:YndM family protein n=1 Tax=Fodinisporobacter ferrooxydans TaxID=2901836 RepID=A0ABY4CFC5_9BACL|nr:YndM family protein [Alicyclobacillaceae bacterium MYW30-H2]
MNDLFHLSLKNFLMKLILFSSILYLADRLVPSLYPNFSPIFTTGLCLSVVGMIADLTIVPLFDNIPALFMGFPGITLIVWVLAKFYPDTHVSLLQAGTLALCLAPFEYLLHVYILRHLKRT